MHLPPEIDLYCERTVRGLFDEPLGLLSNAAFLIAAICLLRQPNQSRVSYVLTAWLAAIGIGSGFFHAFATHTTLLMDVIPIQGFILTAIWVLYSTQLRWKWWWILILIAMFVGVSAQVPGHWINGSAGYLPAWTLLAIATLLHHASPSKRYLVMASVLFPISLTFRSIDNYLCDAIPFGTHFVWHCCNALVLYWIVRAHQAWLVTHKPIGDSARGAYTPSHD